MVIQSRSLVPGGDTANCGLGRDRRKFQAGWRCSDEVEIEGLATFPNRTDKNRIKRRHSMSIDFH